MKNRQMTVISAVLFLVLSLGLGQQVYAESYINQASNLCKAEASAKYGSESEPVRLKFKAAMGNQVSPRVLLQVLPRNADSFKVVCDVDGRAWQVVSVERKDRLDDLQLVGARNNNVAP
ncbi:MAG: hypothetical protein KKF24_13545 [Gammaproteobacteria bacterium]|nr:hypothetical protein [Zhongshania sp.]MBU0539905.1 hypothetical protein [Gammaproteobacteria bacterium]MBU1833705.1 hypothetical protein [Gammaproteobacteria bacterium]